MKRKRNLPVVEESEEEEVAQNVDEESQSDDDSLQDDGEYTHEDLMEMEAVFGLKNDEQDEAERRPCINNTERLLEKLEEIRLGKAQGFDELPWEDTQVIVASKSLQEELKGKVEDDFTRESAIVAQALEAANQAVEKFQELGIPYTRPNDYFAEMVKTDEHMDKVRRKLLADKTKIEAQEERRKQRQLKKFGKQVQKEKEKQKSMDKKSAMDAVKKWRKDGKPGDMEDADFLKTLEKQDNEPNKKRGISLPKAGEKRKQTKRDAKNEKYGFGGPKKRARKNTADSAADYSQFNVKANRTPSKDLMKKLPMKKQQQLAKKNRPGKNKRRQKK